MYAKGNKRMKDEGLDNPELKILVRFLIDECANIGKIPKIGKLLLNILYKYNDISVYFI